MACTERTLRSPGRAAYNFTQIPNIFRHTQYGMATDGSPTYAMNPLRRRSATRQRSGALSPVSWAIRRRRAEPTLPELIMDEHIRVLYRQTPVAVIANVVNAALTGAVLAPIAGQGLVLIWISLTVLLSLARWRVWQAYADEYQGPARRNPGRG